MRYRKLGGSGIEASVIGFGAWAIGGWMWGGSDEQDAVRAIHASLDAGVNLLDTAPIYGMGVSEEVVGKAICDRRDKAVVATKCGLIWHAERGVFMFNTDPDRIRPEGATKVYRCLAPDVIRYEVEQSLRRLGTDRIELYQTHWQDKTVPIADTMATLLDLQREGKIRAIGCSNATPAQMDDYRAVGRLDVDQEVYSMLRRDHETANLPYCTRHDVAFLAYSPLAQGLLTGKVGPDRVFDKDDQRAGNSAFSVENRARVAALLEEIRPVADRHAIGFGQLALAWALAQPGCTHVLPGARDAKQAQENARAGDVVLDADDNERIVTALDRHRPA